MAVVAVIGWGFISLYSSKNAAESQAQALQVDYNQLQQENRNLSSEIQYFQDPANLIKQLKAQTNYKNPGEGLIIVVPGTTGTVTSTTSTP